MNDNNEETRLGHDPLEWLMDDDEDDDQVETEETNPSTPVEASSQPNTVESDEDDKIEEQTDSSLEPQTPVVATPIEPEPVTLETSNHENDASQEVEIIQDAGPSSMDEVIDDDGAWGIFASEDYGIPLDDHPPEPSLEDDGTWGLFEEEEETGDHGKVLRLELPSLMVISQIITIKQSFKVDSDEVSIVNINGSAVDDADAAGIQLLYALTATLSNSGIEVRMFDSSQVLKTRIATAGLSDYFETFV
jgi:ABC-type transporter Mla MlaB component